jgi:hypothetical protein
MRFGEYLRGYKAKGSGQNPLPLIICHGLESLLKAAKSELRLFSSPLSFDKPPAVPTEIVGGGDGLCQTPILDWLKSAFSR